MSVKNVLFLVRRSDKISIRRYLLVARQLEKLNIKSCFMNISESPDVIKETAKELNLDMGYFPEYGMDSYRICRPLELLNSFIYRLKRTLFARDRYAVKVISNDVESISPDNANFSELLEILNFDTDFIVTRYYEESYPRWSFYVKRASDKVKQIKPDYIVYDLEMHSEIRSFLYAAKKNSVRIISMQHGEGFGIEYANIPRLADYYIAYSPWNVENIKMLQVEDKNIFLTGMPDTDEIYDYSSEKIREEFLLRYNLPLNKKMILVALRPASADGYIKINTQLIEDIGAVFGNNPSYEILIKLHNSDYITGNRFCYKNARYSNFKVIDSDYSFSKLLKISDYMITHLSSCVVDAALMGVSTIVIDFDDSGIVPDWNSYGVFNKIASSRLAETLTDIKNNRYSFKTANEARERFITRFRFKYDNNAARRIAEVIQSCDVGVKA